MTEINPSNGTLENLLRDAVHAALSQEDLQLKCQKAAERAVDQAIDAAFSRGGAFVGMVTKAVQEALPVVRPDDMSTFAQSVRLVVQNRLLNLASQTAKIQMDEVLKRLVPDSTVITAAELREDFIEKLKHENSLSDCDCYTEDHDPEMTWRTEQSSSTKGWFDLVISKEENASRYSSKDAVVMRFKPTDSDENLHECWYCTVGHSADLAKCSLFMGPLYGFDALVFRLATGTAKLSMSKAQIEADSFLNV